VSTTGKVRGAWCMVRGAKDQKITRKKDEKSGGHGKGFFTKRSRKRTLCVFSFFLGFLRVIFKSFPFIPLRAPIFSQFSPCNLLIFSLHPLRAPVFSRFGRYLFSGFFGARQKEQHSCGNLFIK
jgi:hypothetical protein